MLQEIAPHIFDNAYKVPERKADDVIFIFNGRNVFLHQNDEEIHFLNRKEIEVPFEDTYLFSIDGQAYFLTELNEETIENLKKKGYDFTTMFATRTMNPKTGVFASSVGFQLAEWYRTSKFCGACGTKTVHDDKLRMVKCPKCGNSIFPKVQPAVIVGLIDGDRILMTKYAGREYTRYALIAGFAEIGETAEETVAREVMEEVGLKVKNVRYYKSQPWGFESDLLLGFYCDLDGDDKVKMDEEELAVAEWIYRDDMEERKDDISLTSEMMETFRLGLA